MKTNKLNWLSYITCFGMVLVLLNGALVTKTGSGQGCGSDWTIWLCNGKFVPAKTIESLIEYSHRAVSGIVGILVLVLFILVWKYVKERKDTLWYASIALFFTYVQAVMGALAVVKGQVPAVMALHYGFSLLAFAGTLMLSIGLYRRSKGLADPPRTLPAVSKRFRNSVWLVAIYSYIVVYVGAFVRHTESWGGCQGWPLCNGEVIPALHGSTLIAFLHRVAALLLLIVVAVMAHFAYHRHKHVREIRIAGVWALVLCASQVLSGAWLVLSMHNENAHLYASLLHTVLVSGLFGVLCYLSARVLQLGKGDSR